MDLQKWWMQKNFFFFWDIFSCIRVNHYCSYRYCYVSFTLSMEKGFFFQALHIRLGLRIRNLVIAWKKIPLKKIWVFWIWNLSFFFQRNKENRQSNLSNASQLRSEIIFFSQVRNYSNFFKKNWIITYLIINWILIIIEIIINWIIEYWILIK